ncbi:hypothetical protein C8R45DRAFT_619327 [Mycena sanguinolenta]|nr:hypothetical protein C8R45DRAFT_619327 [Mycena sanguinolenta]
MRIRCSFFLLLAARIAPGRKKRPRHARMVNSPSVHCLQLAIAPQSCVNGIRNNGWNCQVLTTSQRHPLARDALYSSPRNNSAICTRHSKISSQDAMRMQCE